MKTINYCIDLLLNNKIPSCELEDNNITIQLQPSATCDKSIPYAILKYSYKCKFILLSPGKYDIYGKVEVELQSNNIVIFAYDNSVIVENTYNSNVTINLYGYSKLTTRNSTVCNDNCINAYDKSFVYSYMSGYNIMFRNYSTGMIESSGYKVHLYDCSKVQVKGICGMKDNIYLLIFTYDQSKLWGTIYNGLVLADYSSNVTLIGKGDIVADGNSKICARGNLNIKLNSKYSYIDAGDFCKIDIDERILKFESCIKTHGNNVRIKSIDNIPITLSDWIKTNCLDIGQIYIDSNTEVILYKAVSDEYTTQDGTENETVWMPGTIVEMSTKDWTPASGECGKGKFHACGNPISCMEFRHGVADRFVAIKVNKNDIFLWSQLCHERNYELHSYYPTKITFRKGEVLYECDVNGNRINSYE